MKVLFVYPDLSVNAAGKVSLGIAHLSAYLKQLGHRVSLLHIVRPVGREEFLERLRGEAADLIAFSATTHMFPHAAQWAAWSKSGANTPVICGGIHPTLAPEEAIGAVGVDMICVGEGELALGELCEGLERDRDITRIANLWVQRGGRVYRNAPRPLLEDLDALPFADRGIFLTAGQLPDFEQKRAVFMAGRGCPYRCTYCCNYRLRQVYSNRHKYVRWRRVEGVLQEVEQVVKDYPFVESLHFHDDILMLDRKWFRDFAEGLAARTSLPFTCNGHCRLLTPETVRLLKKANCASVAIGVESGSQRIRHDVLQRPVSTEQIERAFALCRRQGIATYAFNMVGIPSETMAEALETVKLNARIKPQASQVSIFFPYPGTQLYELSQACDYIVPGQILDSYFEDTVLRLPTFPREQILFVASYFLDLVGLYARLYKLPGRVRRPLMGALDALLCSRFFPHGLLVRRRKLVARLGSLPMRLRLRLGRYGRRLWPAGRPLAVGLKAGQE